MLTFDAFELTWLAVIGACAALAVAAIAYTRPRVALVGSYVLLAIANTKFRLRSPTDPLTGSIDAQIAMELILYAVIALVVLMTAISAGRRRPFAPGEVLLLAFIGLALASTLWSPSRSLTAVRAFQMATVGALALTSVQLLGAAGAVRGAAGALVAYVLGCSAMAAIVGTRSMDEYTFRFTWFAMHPITAGSAAAVASLLVLGRALYDDRRRGFAATRGVRWFLVATLSTILVLTNSRGPLLAFLVAIGFVAWKSMRAGLLRALVAASVLLVLSLAIYSEPISTFANRAHSSDSFVAKWLFRGGDVQSLRGLNGRLEVWEAAAPLIAQQPLFGYGYHGSRALLFQRIPWASYAHSAYVQSLLDFGVVGALLIWGVVGFAFLALASRPFGAITGSPWCDASLTGTAAYILVVAISSESFIATPGYEALVVFLLVSSVGQCRVPVAPPHAYRVWARRPVRPLQTTVASTSRFSGRG
jgi:O-antigen ligase